MWRERLLLVDWFNAVIGEVVSGTSQEVEEEGVDNWFLTSR